jgi:hypothetical protein
MLRSLTAALAAGLGALLAPFKTRFVEAADDKRSVVPEDGILVEDIEAMREAKTSELNALMELVRAALRAKLFGASTDRWIHVKAIYPDQVIIVSEAGRYVAYPYTVGEDNVCTLGDPTEVVEQYSAVAMREASSQLIEAKDDKAAKFEIVIVRAGLSRNRNYYPDAVLREAVPLFDKVRVFVKPDVVHLQGGGRDVNRLIGQVSEPRFVEGADTDTGEIRGILEFIEDADPLANKMREALKKDMQDLFGFSMDASGSSDKRMVEAKPVRFAKKIKKVDSVDCIVEPGAGGALVRMVEAADPDNSLENEDMLRKKLIAKIRAKLPAARLKALGDLDKLGDDALETAYREAVQEEEPDDDTPSAPANAGGVTEDRLREALAVQDNKNKALQTVNASSLPKAAKDRLVVLIGAEANPTSEVVTRMIEAERTYISQFTESGKVRGLGNITVEDESIKIDDMFDAFFDKKHKNHRHAQSFKECYIRATGDTLVTGRMRDCDLGRMAEALGVFREALDTASFPNVLGDSISRRMIRDYRDPGIYDGWQQLIDTVPVSDFRTQERTRWGGYGDLPTVEQNDPYPDLVSPGDESASYAVAKRGGIERLSLEAIKNDDVGVIRRIPINMSRAAKRTLAKFVFDFFRLNPTLEDGTAWFHASRGNLMTVAFSAAEFAVHRLAQMKRTELSSAERIGIPPKFMIAALDLVESMVDAFRRNTNNDETFVQSLKPSIVPVWYWTDVNDWCTLPDPMDMPVIELGFLDGREEPEIFVQDGPTIGSMFTNDQVSYKIRHTYGGNVTEPRGGTKAVVA